MTRSECPVVAATGGHVDDFFFRRKGRQQGLGNSKKMTARSLSLENVGNFIHCGARVEHQKSGAYLLSQNEFVDERPEIQIPSHRRKDKESPVSHQEHTELRGLLGGLGWKCEQTGLQHRAATGLQRSRVQHVTVQGMIEANRLLQQVKKKSNKRHESSAFQRRSV